VPIVCSRHGAKRNTVGRSANGGGGSREEHAVILDRFRPGRRRPGSACVTRKLYTENSDSGILVVQSAKDQMPGESLFSDRCVVAAL
jgi:hypothetical protein